jgi:sec-independent protein translocase protein TatA
MHMPGFGSWIVIAVIGVLFFGKRLPEVGKSVAGAIVNFKKGLKEAQDEIERSSNAPSTPVLMSGSAAAALPADAKFDPYTGKPIDAPKFDPYTGQPLTGDANVSVSHGEPQEAAASH